WEEPEEGRWICTSFTLDADAGTLRISSESAGFGSGRALSLRLLGFDQSSFTDLTGPAGPLTVAPADGALHVDIPLPERADHIELRSRGFTSIGTNDVLKQVTALLNVAQIGFALKERLLSSIGTFGQQGAA